MAEPENATLRMLREIRAEQEAMRDDFRVLSAITMRIDTTTSSILEQLRVRLQSKPMANQILIDRFTQVYEENLWLDGETVSGPGSRKGSHSVVAAISALNTIKEQIGFKSINDIPCGDFNWIGAFLESAPGVRYRGFDIVAKLIEQNKMLYPRYEFGLLDITSASPPRADLIFSKDLFNHLLNEDVIKVIINMKRSKSTYLLASNNFGWANEELTYNAGNCSRYLDLCAAPFDLLPPLWQTDYMGLWKLSDIGPLAQAE